MSAGQQIIPGHGMTGLEAAIMERFDEGQHEVAIARALDLSRARVRSVISMFREGRADAWEDAARQGSLELLAAIRRLAARTGAMPR